jgi:PAS domain S-box-containing protein
MFDFMRAGMEPSTYREHPPPATVLALANRRPIRNFDDASALAQAILDTIRDPLLVLDQNLRVVAANRVYCQKFRMSRQDIQGRPVYGLGDGQWDIPELRMLLEEIAPSRAAVPTYEVERDFPIIGRRTMLLSSSEVFNERETERLILLAIEDITDRRSAEREMAELLRQKEMLLREMQHRVANSLQIIASILLLKARTVQSEETRLHLHDAHQRVMSVATIQQQLQSSGENKPIEVGSYLSRLCSTLAASMIGDSRPISVKVEADAGTMACSEAVSIGLITTELVINALKHGFSAGVAGQILVRYSTNQAYLWCLAVSDNGGGLQQDGSGSGHAGLGTSIVEALAHQLKAGVEISSGSSGMTVSIVRNV